MPSHSDRLEIMQSAARKISLHPSVDLEPYARQTAGYSGADLQALVYNAHLDAIHETLAPAVDAAGQVASSAAPDSEDLDYVIVGGADQGKVLSRAERASIDKRVSSAIEAVKRLGRNQTDPLYQQLEQILSAMRDSAKSSRARQSKGTATASPSSKEPVRAIRVATAAKRGAETRFVTQTHVEDRHLRKSLQTTRPSVPEDELKRLRRM